MPCWVSVRSLNILTISCSFSVNSEGELAKLVGVAQSMIAKYESGIAVPNIVLGVQIAKKLGTASEELVQ